MVRASTPLRGQQLELEGGQGPAVTAWVSASLHMFPALLPTHASCPCLTQEDAAAPRLPVARSPLAGHLHPQAIFESQLQVLKGRLWSAKHRQGGSCDWEEGGWAVPTRARASFYWEKELRSQGKKKKKSHWRLRRCPPKGH